ncbi:hypothetical protein GcM3_114014 [Golovinomyces cichoracearum]|uniref:Uncharacterized protein n=1 Tax=Golovinomyces cichoracearum TaxID=62708 RepID=A0A420I8G0_9PEZI|nr:hypothetical protein GcM3_114014 [Golovinomyces cichoracearum]
MSTILQTFRPFIIAHLDCLYLTSTTPLRSLDEVLQNPLGVVTKLFRLMIGY